MLRIVKSKNASAAANYFTQALATDEYYAQGSQTPGRWGGQLAERFGLFGEVDAEQFRRLLNNLHPTTAEKLTVRMRADRRPGFDVTFNAPKSVTLAWALLGDERVPAALERAVARTMKEVEKEAATRVRKGKEDSDRPTGTLLWASFTHTTARPVGGVPDPQLHVHAYVVNCTYDSEEQRVKALQLGLLYPKVPLYEALFHHFLAGEMRELGYGVRTAGKFWELEGFERPLIELFSRRTTLIEKTAREKKIVRAKEKAGLGARTRAPKSKHLSLETMRSEWRARAGDAARAPRTFKARPPLSKKDRTRDALEFVSRKLLERAAVVSERQLVQEVLRYAPGEVDLTKFRSHYQKLGLIRAELDGGPFVTSKEAVAEEKRLVELVKGTQGCWRGLSDLAPQFQKQTASSMAERLMRSPDGVVVLEGSAGTGKTTVARELDSLLRQSGSRLLALAPTAKASRGTLRAEGFAGAETIARFLGNEEQQKRTRGGMIWVDEAGQVSTRDVISLIEIAQKHSARVILVGDRGQHRSVARGGCLYSLITHAGVIPFQLGEIRRQQGEWKTAVELLAGGRCGEALRRLTGMNAVKRLEADELTLAASTEYVDAVQAGRKVSLLTATNKDRERLNDCVREVLRDRLQLGRGRTVPSLQSLQLGITEKQRPEMYARGQVVVFHRLCRRPPAGTRFVPGEQWKVMGRDPFGNVMVRKGLKIDALPLKYAKHFDVFEQRTLEVARGDLVQLTRNTRVESSSQRAWNAIPFNRRKLYGELANGSTHRVVAIKRSGAIELDSGHTLPAGFAFLRHGYCQTTYMAQSSTADLAILCVAKPLAMDNDRMLYVGVSRGREASVYLAKGTDWDHVIAKKEPVVTPIEVASSGYLVEESQREHLRAAALEAERIEAERGRAHEVVR